MEFMNTLKLIAVIVGAIGFFTGLIMVCLGLSATGTIDFKILFVEGKLTTASAGLLVMCLSVILILGTIWKPVTRRFTKEKEKKPGRDGQPAEEKYKITREDEGIKYVKLSEGKDFRSNFRKRVVFGVAPKIWRFIWSVLDWIRKTNYDVGKITCSFIRKSDMGYCSAQVA